MQRTCQHMPEPQPENASSTSAASLHLDQCLTPTYRPGNMRAVARKTFAEGMNEATL